MVFILSLREKCTGWILPAEATSTQQWMSFDAPRHPPLVVDELAEMCVTDERVEERTERLDCSRRHLSVVALCTPLLK